MAKRTEDNQIPALNTECVKRLKQLRQKMGMSRPKFAELLGIPPTTLKNYENGYREISGGLLLVIAKHPELKQHFQWLCGNGGE